MERLETSYVVPGVTPQQCFEYVGDADNGTEWNSFAKEVIAHGEEGLGRIVETRVGFVGITFGINGEVTTYEPYSRYGVTSTFPFHAELGATFTAQGSDTLVDSYFQIEPGKFFPVPKMVLRKALKMQFDKDTRSLRACFGQLAEG